MTYIKSRSWHILALVDAVGWRTRCGITLPEDALMSDALPLADRSCENCLRYTASDEYVPEPTDGSTEGTRG